MHSTIKGLRSLLPIFGSFLNLVRKVANYNRRKFQTTSPELPPAEINKLSSHGITIGKITSQENTDKIPVTKKITWKGRRVNITQFFDAQNFDKRDARSIKKLMDGFAQYTKKQLKKEQLKKTPMHMQIGTSKVDIGEKQALHKRILGVLLGSIFKGLKPPAPPEK